MNITHLLLGAGISLGLFYLIVRYFGVSDEEFKKMFFDERDDS